MFLRALLDTFFPPLCHVCRSFVPDAGGIHLCAACRDKVAPVRSPLCPVCGLPFATEDGIDHPCGPCLTTRPPFDAARSAARFEGPVQALIHRFKYGGKVHLARPLGLLAAESLSDFVPAGGADFIVPVPLHRRRLRERGFNQAQLLGRVLAKQWRIPLSVDNLRRIRWTEPQTGLAADDRRRNVRGAFRVADPSRFRERRLLLVDDVYTTGGTVTECARALKAAGAGEVLAVTVARAVL